MSHPDDDATQPQAPPPGQAAVPPTPPYQPMYPPPAPAPTPAAVPPPPPPPPASTPPYASAPPPAVPPRAVARHQRQSRRTALTALAVACFLVAAAFIGYTMGAGKGTSSNAVGSFPSAQSQFPGYSPGSSSGTSGSSGSSSGNGQQSSIDVNSIASKVSPSIVNLTSSLDNGEAAGTGIVVSPSGLAITNNHVIQYSNDLQAEIGGNGQEHPAKVLGYDMQNDVALVQIEGVSGLTAASLGNSSNLQVGDAIVALGNAGGKGGSPSVVSGTVTGVDQQITAADQDGSNAETLDHLIQIDANIQPGDSGGPLVDAAGDVVGMNAAASSGNGGFGFGGQAANEGYAIRVQDALAIAKKIESGQGSDTIHVGAHRAMLGVGVQDTASGDPFGGNGAGGSSNGQGNPNGAQVTQVQSGSGADKAGIQAGDTIVGLDGSTITSAQQLTHALVKYSPKDTVSVEWDDSSGQSHTATIELGSGSPA